MRHQSPNITPIGRQQRAKKKFFTFAAHTI